MITSKYKLFLFLFLFLNNILALGVSPGIVNLNFEPEKLDSFEINVLNSPLKTQDIEIYSNLFSINESIREEFAGVLSLDENYFSFTEDIPSKTVKVLVKFPKGFSQAGMHELRVGARTFVENTGGMMATAGNEVRVFVNVSEKYASSAFAIPKKLRILNVNAKPVKKGEKAEVEIQVKSESTEILKRVRGRIRLVYNGADLASADTQVEDIFPGETRVLTTSFFTVDFPVASIPINAEVTVGENVERATGNLVILENPDLSDEGKLCKKYGSCSWCWFWIAVLVIIIIVLLFLLFRGKGKGIGSYDFSSESSSGEGKY